MKFKKIYFGYGWKLIGSFLLYAAFLLFVGKFLIAALNREKTEISLLLGKSVVVGKDTLQIVDFSRLTETYKLSNGISVSFEYAERNLANK